MRAPWALQHALWPQQSNEQSMQLSESVRRAYKTLLEAVVSTLSRRQRRSSYPPLSWGIHLASQRMVRLELVLEAVQGGNLSRETLTLTDTRDDLITELALGQGVTLHLLPVVEHALRERLSTGLSTEI